jgi:hypothetical protein
MWEYLKHPGLLLRKIRSFEDLRYMVKILIMGASMKLRQGKKLTTSKDFIYGKKQYV